MFNIQQADSLDQNIVDLMYERIDNVVTDLAEAPLEREAFDALDLPDAE